MTIRARGPKAAAFFLAPQEKPAMPRSALRDQTQTNRTANDADSGLALVRVLRHPRIMRKPPAKRHRPRRSASAEASLRAEIERVDRMTIEERVKAALSMGKRFSWVQPAVKQP